MHHSTVFGMSLSYPPPLSFLPSPLPLPSSHSIVQRLLNDYDFDRAHQSATVILLKICRFRKWATPKKSLWSQLFYVSPKVCMEIIGGWTHWKADSAFSHDEALVNKSDSCIVPFFDPSGNFQYFRIEFVISRHVSITFFPLWMWISFGGPSSILQQLISHPKLEVLP